MSAMTSFTLRSLAKNRVRTAVTIAGVALAAALLTGVLSCVTSLNAFLYDREVADNGTWTASAWINDETAVQSARDSEHVTDFLTMRDVGFAQLDEQTQQLGLEYLPVLSVEGDAEAAERICGIRADEGRFPSSSGEIMLNASWKNMTSLSDEPLEVGSTITLDVGQRRVVESSANENPSDLAHAHTGTDGYHEDGEVDTIHAGDILDSGWAYVDAETDGGAYDEELVNAHARTYTVVGFYESSNIATRTALGSAAITAEDGEELAGTGDAGESEAGTKIFLVTTGFSTQEDLSQAMSDLLGVESVSLHHAVLNYAGVTDDRAVWDTFARFALILAAVIIIACVSLIYNAFAISVAERTRQFGLLSSIGASGKQIRSAIMFEAFVIAAIGVPIGLLAGIGGTALVLSIIGPSIVALYGAGDDVAFSVALDPAAIAFAAALTLVTVLVSVWVPAHRAASVSAVDAIRRTQDVRPAKERKTGQRANKEQSVSKLWKPRGINIERAFGTPGYIARANRKRGRAKGRAASVSLALAIVLLMTAGSLSTTLGMLTDAMTAGDADTDLTFSAHSSENGNIDEQIEDYEELYRTLLSVEGIQERGRSYYASATAIIPADMAGKDLATSEVESNSSSMDHALLSDKSVVSMCNFVFLSDEDFRTYAEQAGANSGQLATGKACAVAITGAYGNNGSLYTYRENFRDTGTVNVVSGATSKGEPVYCLGFETQYVSAGESESGQDALRVSCTGTMVDDSYTAVDEVPFEELDITTTPFEVVALTDEQPAENTAASELPTFVLPLSAAHDVLGGANESAAAENAANERISSSFFSPYLSMSALFDAEDHARVAEDLTQAAKDAGAHTFSDSYLGGIAFIVNDNVAYQEQNGMLIAIINLFTMLFTGILALIAMANVFNTVTNGLILRRREFAVMRSVGLGNSAFRRMIACECIGYGVRGLVPGIIISTLVAYLLYDAMTQSVQGLTFTLPWTHIGIAVALVVIVMAASVAYGMRRCRTDSIVDALRMDVA